MTISLSAVRLCWIIVYQEFFLFQLNKVYKNHSIAFTVFCICWHHAALYDVMPIENIQNVCSRIQVNATVATHQHYLISARNGSISVILSHAHFAYKYTETGTSRTIREDWILGLSDDINHSSCSALFHSLQAPSTRSVMTRFQLTLRSNSFSRSLADSSCPNRQIPCWETAERYKYTKTHTLCAHIVHLSFSLSTLFSLLLAAQIYSAS